MDKNTLTTFIKKYHLNGLIEAVQLNVANSTLSTKARTADKTFMVDIIQKKSDLPDAKIGVHNSPELLKQLSNLGANISIEYFTNPTDAAKVVYIIIDDGKLEQTHMCAELSVIPDQPNLKTIPSSYEVEIVLDDDFVTNFLAAKASLGSSDLFTLVMNKKKQRLEMVLGYQSKIPSSRVALGLTTNDGKDSVTAPITFSAKNLKEILSANSEVKDAVLKINEGGLAFVEYDSPEFQSKYYMVKVDSDD